MPNSPRSAPAQKALPSPVISSAPDFGIGMRCLQKFGKFVPHLYIEGIQCLGAVQSNVGHPVVFLKKQRRVGRHSLINRFPSSLVPLVFFFPHCQRHGAPVQVFHFHFGIAQSYIL